MSGNGEYFCHSQMLIKWWRLLLVKVYLFKVPAEAITGVVVGARASAQLRNAIKTSINGSSDLRHVRLRFCRPDPREFSLRLSETAD